MDSEWKFDPMAKDNNFHIAIRNREDNSVIIEWDEGPEALIDAIISSHQKRMDLYYEQKDAPDTLQFAREYCFIHNKLIKDLTADDYTIIWQRFLYEMEQHFLLNVDPIEPKEEEEEKPDETSELPDSDNQSDE